MAPTSGLHPDRRSVTTRHFTPTNAAYISTAKPISTSSTTPSILSTSLLPICACACSVRFSAAETTLAEGAVSLQRADGSNLIRLHPGQRAIYDTQDEQLEIKEVPVGDHLALSYGIITLDGVPLRQIADRIEELYGVKLRLIDDDAPDANYNFSFQKDTPIEDVIELLQFISGTRFEILRYPDSD